MTVRLRDLPDDVQARVRAERRTAKRAGAARTPATRIRGPEGGATAQAPLSEEPAAPLVFVVPMPPLITNAGGQRSRHWRALEREKAEYWDALDFVALGWTGGPGYRMPPVPATPLERAVVSSHMTLGGAMDDDNAIARHKWLIDWLVGAGYLASDRRTCLRWAALPTQTVTRKTPALLRLTLTPATHAADP